MLCSLLSNGLYRLNKNLGSDARAKDHRAPANFELEIAVEIGIVQHHQTSGWRQTNGIQVTQQAGIIVFHATDVSLLTVP